MRRRDADESEAAQAQEYCRERREEGVIVGDAAERRQHESAGTWQRGRRAVLVVVEWQGVSAKNWRRMFSILVPPRSRTHSWLIAAPATHPGARKTRQSHATRSCTTTARIHLAIPRHTDRTLVCSLTPSSTCPPRHTRPRQRAPAARRSTPFSTAPSAASTSRRGPPILCGSRRG